jgi:hypothetical protein
MTPAPALLRTHSIKSQSPGTSSDSLRMSSALSRACRSAAKLLLQQLLPALLSTISPASGPGGAQGIGRAKEAHQLLGRQGDDTARRRGSFVRPERLSVFQMWSRYSYILAELQRLVRDPRFQLLAFFLQLVLGSFSALVLQSWKLSPCLSVFSSSCLSLCTLCLNYTDHAARLVPSPPSP